VRWLHGKIRAIAVSGWTGVAPGAFEGVILSALGAPAYWAAATSASWTAGWLTVSWLRDR
jgi:hypothetical protein